MSEKKHLMIGGFCLPLDAETLEGLPIDPGGVLQFDFVYRFIRFAVRYEDCADFGKFRIAGDVGPMPYSAESPAARAGLNRIVFRSRDDWGPWLKQAQGRIVLGGEFQMKRPVTADNLIAQTAQFLIPAIPYLDLIALYVRPPMAPAKRGESAVRPEWRKAKALPAPKRS